MEGTRIWIEANVGLWKASVLAVCAWPIGLVYALPAAFAWVDLHRGVARGWTDWLGAACGSMTVASWLLLTHAGELLAAHPFVLAGWIVAVTTSSLLLVRRFGPAWNRWLGLGYDGGSTTTRPSES